MNNILNSVTLSAAPGVIVFRVWILIVPLMGLFALGILAFVLLKSREGKFSLGSFFSLIFSAILVLPVVAVMAYLLARSAPQLTEQPATITQRVEVRELIDASRPVPQFPEATQPIDQRIESRELIVTDSPVPVVEAIPVTMNKPSVERDPNLPEWVGQPDVVSGESRLVSLSSQQYATVEEAERGVLREAEVRIQKDFEKTYPYKGSWVFPEGFVEKHYLSEPYVEKTTGTTENATFEMVRVHRRLTLSSAAHKKLYPVWREQIVERRLWTLGSLLGVFTLILGATATYLRLDAATSGAYRLRLKLATVALIVAGGMGVAMILPV